MDDKVKISQLDEGVIGTDDLIPFVDVSDTTQSPEGSTKWGKKVSITENSYTATEKDKVANIPTNTNQELSTLYTNKVDKVVGKELSDTNYTSGDKSKVNNLPADQNTKNTSLDSKNTSQDALIAQNTLKYTAAQVDSLITTLNGTINTLSNTSSTEDTRLDGLITSLTSVVSGLTTLTGTHTTDISTIQTLLLSDESTLNTLQEVVDFIEANKDSLDNLTISNIAGLQAALNTLQANIDVSNTAITNGLDLKANLAGGNNFDGLQSIGQLSHDNGIEIKGFDTQSGKSLVIGVNQYGVVALGGSVEILNFSGVEGKLNDNKGFRFGANNNYIIGFESSTGNLNICNGDTLSSNKIIEITPTGEVKASNKFGVKLDTANPTYDFSIGNGTNATQAGWNIESHNVNSGDAGLNLESSGTTARLINVSNSGANRQKMMFTHTNGAKNTFGISDSSDSGATWNPVFTVTPDEGVGIFKNDPTEALDVNGNVKVNGDIRIEDNHFLRIGSGNDARLSHNGSETIFDVRSGDLVFKNTSAQEILRINKSGGINGISMNDNTIKDLSNIYSKAYSIPNGVDVVEGFSALGSGGITSLMTGDWSDVLPKKEPINIEYWDYGTSTWVDWSSQKSAIKNLMSGYPKNPTFTVNGNKRKWRFTLDFGSDKWNSGGMFGFFVDYSPSGTDYSGGSKPVNVLVERDADASFSSPLVKISGGTLHNKGVYRRTTGFSSSEAFYRFTFEGLETTQYTTYKYIKLLTSRTSYGTPHGKPMMWDGEQQVSLGGVYSPHERLTVFGNSESGTSEVIKLINLGDGSTRIRLVNSSGNGNGFQIINNENDGEVNLQNFANSDLSFWTNGTRRMTVDAGGNIGIGTTAPDAKLEVAQPTSDGGTVKLGRKSGNPTIKSTDDFLIIDTASSSGWSALNYYVGADLWLNRGGGSVTIGSTLNTGTEKLLVDGKIKATDINFTGLPTSSTGLSTGDVWSDGGNLKIV